MILATADSTTPVGAGKKLVDARERQSLFLNREREQAQVRGRWRRRISRQSATSFVHPLRVGSPSVRV